MSADNWAICPRCLDEAKAEAQARFQAAFEAYGKVTPEEYERIRDLAQEPIDKDVLQTFREDYEFYGAENGTVTAVYSGHCSKCSLGVDFKHEQTFYERDEVLLDARINERR